MISVQNLDYQKTNEEQLKMLTMSLDIKCIIFLVFLTFKNIWLYKEKLIAIHCELW